MVQQLGANYLLSQSTGVQYECYRRNTWIVVIDGFDTELTAQECDLPGWSLDQIAVRHVNDEVKIAGRPTFKNVKITFLDSISPAIHSEFYNWATTVYDPKTHMKGYASKYKKQGTIHQFDTEMQNERIWTCLGLWPIQSPGQNESLTYDDHGVLKISIDLSCDYAFLGAAAA